ncbi:hypothetical protein AMTRI_Chr03g145010 [Amborella trichopoda]|uniref:Uncharacterized protein n=1 Tax=Amborella trichopoda TaxID=13333 RepID=U5D5K1_AMBTC|nr:hypothetical protein AMTR_s00048p00177400 [Amborella trichopoda]
MEREEESVILKMAPPRLEDAGLEDCALSLESIKLAFAKAADSLKSQAIDPSDDGQDVPDSLQDVPLDEEEGNPNPKSCGNRIPIVPEQDSGHDSLLIGSNTVEVEDGDDLLEPGLPGSEEGRACVEGLQGLDIKERERERKIKKKKKKRFLRW